MTSFLYALNIGTLATWLTVTGASTVAQVVRVSDRLPRLQEEHLGEAEIAILPMAMGSAPPSASQDAPAAEESMALDPVAEPEPEEVPEIPEIPELPEAPDLPELAEMDPLPEIPDLPARPDGALKPKPRPATASNNQAKQQPRATTRRTSGSGQGTGTGDGTARGSGNSPVGSDRWAGGRMPKPIYPPASRRNGEQGRVVVAFTVDERGYVVSARITSPSPHSALNDAALNSVRRWKFKPGPRASASRPIIFRLN